MRSMGVEVNSSDGGAGSFACRNAGVPGSTSVRMRQSAMGVHEYNAGDYFCLTVFNGSTTAQTVTPNSADNPVNLWAAAKAGEAAGKKTYAGLSAVTWGWIALGTAAVVGIAFAVGGGGRGTTSTQTH